MSTNVFKSTEGNQAEYFVFLKLIRQTVVRDRQRYKPKSRPSSRQRLWRLIDPNLQRPIFLVGAPRSGTTFLGECLAVLPEISYHFEPIATKAASRFVYGGHWTMEKARGFYRSVYSWLLRQHLDADLRFAEKTPRNCFLILFLSDAFPDAQFIHIIRDGRDAALSYSKKPWLQAATSGSGRMEPGGHKVGAFTRFWVEPERVHEFETTSDIHRCIWAWRRFAASAIEAAAQLPPDRYHELRYESLACNPEDEAKQLLNFIGITDANSRDLFHQAVSKVNSNSIGQWRQALSDEQLQQIEQEAGQLLRQLNYCESD